MNDKLTVGGFGGYYRLESWILAETITLATRAFCRKFLNRTNDPCGRLFDQMTQAARSGGRNIAEGSARHATSRETELKLLDVARASIAELHDDYLCWLPDKGQAPWAESSPAAREVRDIRVPPPIDGEDPALAAAERVLEQKKILAKWLDSDDDATAANAMLILCRRVMAMLTRQMASLTEMFVEDGGFTEKMSAARPEARDKKQAEEGAPECPECGKLMRKMTARKGRNAGNQFWSCTGYPDCKGTRPI